MAKLVSKLNLIADRADAACLLALSDTANFILTLIRTFAPVDTGFLRDSYKREQIGELHILIGTMVNYSIFLEYGTSRQAAQPHVLPAFLQAQDFFQTSLKKYLENLG